MTAGLLAVPAVAVEALRIGGGGKTAVIDVGFGHARARQRLTCERSKVAQIPAVLPRRKRLLRIYPTFLAVLELVKAGRISIDENEQITLAHGRVRKTDEVQEWN